ncbi:hypothetical protein C8R45DRAFT_88667 [Mycena sanguinolenta]|nr:hypothetical protein C8R45DRAFT_88667 [Mycena sanguinolenta]
MPSRISTPPRAAPRRRRTRRPRRLHPSTSLHRQMSRGVLRVVSASHLHGPLPPIRSTATPIRSRWRPARRKAQSAHLEHPRRLAESESPRTSDVLTPAQIPSAATAANLATTTKAVNRDAPRRPSSHIYIYPDRRTYTAKPTPPRTKKPRTSTRRVPPVLSARLRAGRGGRGGIRGAVCVRARGCIRLSLPRAEDQEQQVEEEYETALQRHLFDACEAAAYLHLFFLLLFLPLPLVSLERWRGAEDSAIDVGDSFGAFAHAYLHAHVGPKGARTRGGLCSSLSLGLWHRPELQGLASPWAVTHFGWGGKAAPRNKGEDGGAGAEGGRGPMTVGWTVHGLARARYWRFYDPTRDTTTHTTIPSLLLHFSFVIRFLLR